MVARRRIQRFIAYGAAIPLFWNELRLQIWVEAPGRSGVKVLSAPCLNRELGLSAVRSLASEPNCYRHRRPSKLRGRSPAVLVSPVIVQLR